MTARAIVSLSTSMIPPVASTHHQFRKTDQTPPSSPTAPHRLRRKSFPLDRQHIAVTTPASRTIAARIAMLRTPPLQRTPCRQGAAELGALLHADRPSRGLRSVQRVSPGHGKPRAGLPCHRFHRHRAGERRDGQALRALHTHRPRPASSRPRPGRRSGVSASAQHNRAFCKLAPVARRLAWWVKRCAPCGFAEGSVMSGAPARRPRCRLRPRRSTATRRARGFAANAGL